MLARLWGGGGEAAGAAQLSPALREARESLGPELFARVRAHAPLEDDRALAAACGLTTSPQGATVDDDLGALVRSTASAVRACASDDANDAGGAKTKTDPYGRFPIGADALALAYHLSTSRPTDWAYSVLAAGRDADADKGAVPIADVENALRGCLRLVAAAAAAPEGAGTTREGGDGDNDDDSAVPLLARALALGALAAQAESMGGIPAAESSPPPPPPPGAERLSRAGFARWAKHGSGAAVAGLLSVLLRRLGEDAAAPAPGAAPAPARWPRCPRLIVPGGGPDGSKQQQPPLLLSPRAAFLLAPHVPEPRRRDRWTLVYASQRHGKSWSALKGRLAEAGALAAAAVERHLDEAAAAAAAGGGGARGPGRGAGRGARAGPAAGSGPASDAAAGDAGPPATLVLVRDASGAVFGGAAFSPWRRRPSFFGDASAFLFAVSPALRVHHTSGINGSVQYFGAGFASLPNGLGMGGVGPAAGGQFGLFVDSALERGHSRPNATFACGQLSPASQDFDVADVEVWALLTPEEEDDGRGPRAAKQGGGGSVLSDAREGDKNFLAVAGRFDDHSAGLRD